MNIKPRSTRSGKTTPISCPRNKVAQLRAPLNLPVHHSIIVVMGLRGDLNWDPTMPRDASVSEGRCEIFPPGDRRRQDWYTQLKTPAGRWQRNTSWQVATKHIHIYMYINIYSSRLEKPTLAVRETISERLSA